MTVLQEEMQELLAGKGLIRWEAGAEESPSIKRSMLRPAFDEVVARRATALIEGGQRPCSERGVADARSLTSVHGSGPYPPPGPNEPVQSSALVSNGGTVVRIDLVSEPWVGHVACFAHLP